jgi:hypothetical protein
LNRIERKERKVRKGLSLHTMRSRSFAFFAFFAVILQASEEKSSGAFGIICHPGGGAGAWVD